MASDITCEYCRWWSELVARSVDRGLEAMCLNSSGPKNQQWMRTHDSCSAFCEAYGHAVDEPGLPENWHARLDGLKGRAP